MRTIKFRGQRVDNGEWVYGDLIQWKRLGLCAILPQQGDEWESPSDYKVKPETVGQFTGLQDKNGVDVYEGDIMSYKHCYWHKRWWSNIPEIEIIEKECEEQRNNVIQLTSIVTYDDSMFKLDYPISLHDVRINKKEVARRTNCGDAYDEYWDFEVIGNIHQNPELI